MINQGLEPSGYVCVGAVFAPSSVKCSVAGCFAVLLEAVGFVFDSMPADIFDKLVVPVDVFVIALDFGGRGSSRRK